MSVFSSKTNRILHVILGAFLIIGFRVWHLEVVQREEKIRESERPKRRTIVQKADRGTICDRFHIPLAINKIRYNAAIYYNQITQVPALSWKEDPVTGIRVRTTPRKDYIRLLAERLGTELKLDPTRVEDQIHSKASLFPHVPFVIKSGLSEAEHYRLAAMEREWLGVHAEIVSDRFYPKGRIGCDLIGTMGSISSKEYLSIASEIELLQNIIEDWEQGHGYELPPNYPSFEAALHRLQELKEKAYSIQDQVGKSGIEGRFEQPLRGFYGKKIYEMDQKGKFLREMPGGKPAISGQQICLTISSELQEFAESLLAEDEVAREGRSFGFDAETKDRKALKQPWIKGGSIVAMDPSTGEILAMAGTPRFDPNDFTHFSHSEQNVSRWLENERWIGAIWDGRQPMTRERFSPKKGFYEESVPLSWEFFLESVLPEGPLLTFFHRVENVKSAIQVQEDVETILYHSHIHEASVLMDSLYPRSKLFEELKGTEANSALKRLDALLSPLSSNGDRLFAIDMCRLVVHAPAFTDNSLKILGSLKLSQYRSLNQAVCRFEAEQKEKERIEFRKKEFKEWRDTDQKAFLTEKRVFEKEQKLPLRPYLDYLDEKEQELFDAFWTERRLDVLTKFDLLVEGYGKLSEEDKRSVLHTFRSFSQLERPLLGSYRQLRKKKGEQTEKELAASFYPIGGFGHSRSYSFQAQSPQGSIFKIVTAYAALLQTNGTNPLTIVDELKSDGKSQIVATSLAGHPYHRMYKGGRLPRSHAAELGKVDLIGALEQSSNPYFALLASDVLSNPEDLASAARLLGYGAQTGIDLPGEAKGKVPTDLSTNRTGLYSTTMGQHTLLATPLQTASMLSAIANGGKILRPTLVKEIAGPLPNRDTWSSSTPIDDELRFLGFNFPLFTAASPRSEKASMQTQKANVVRSLSLPAQSRQQILEGLDRAVWSSKGSARPGVIKGLLSRPEKLETYLSLRHQMVGKTSTAEILFNPFLNPSSKAQIYKHIWFGAIAFDPRFARFEEPDLVVVVFLRYGDGGKEAAPLAAQVIQKWRAIKKKHG